MTKAAKKSLKKAHGPEPARLKIKGDWKKAVKKSLAKKKPVEGWPKGK